MEQKISNPQKLILSNDKHLKSFRLEFKSIISAKHKNKEMEYGSEIHLMPFFKKLKNRNNS